MQMGGYTKAGIRHIQLSQDNHPDTLYHWVLVSVDMQEMKIFFYNSASGSGQNHKPGGLNILVRVCMLHIAIYMELI